MTLITCPICKASVSKNANACIKCGEPISKKMSSSNGALNLKDPVHLIGIVVCLIFVLIAAGAIILAL